jgi:hypothetical protein
MGAEPEGDMPFGIAAFHVEFHGVFKDRLVVIGGEILQ